MKLVCYTCHKLCEHYVCEHCGSEDVEPFDTDSFQMPDYSGDSQEPDDGNGEW